MFLEIKGSTRRSKRVKNLEEEVEFILSHAENDEDFHSTTNKAQLNSTTPLKQGEIREVKTPTACQAVLLEFQQTPRRSCRKSIKPTQDYEDIVNKSLRLCTRSAAKKLNEVVENEENEVVKPKWTPAKVGRVSQKRNRKSRRTGKGKSKADEEAIVTEGEVDDIKYREEEKAIVKEEMKDVNCKEEINISESGLNSIEDEDFEKNNCGSKLVQETRSCSAEEMPSLIIYEDEQADSVENNKVNTSFEVNNSVECVDNTESLQKATEEEMDTLQMFDEGITEKYTKIALTDTEMQHQTVVSISEGSGSKLSCTAAKLNMGKINKDAEAMVGDEREVEFKKQIDISDLGLSPIEDEDYEKNICESKHKQEIPSHVANEMPSLVIDDDDEQEESNVNDKLNETFEKNNSVEFVDNAESPQKPIEEEMETLHMSDEEFVETPTKCPRIVLTDTEMQNYTVLSTPKESVNKPSCKPKPWNTPKLSSTSKRSAEPYIFPTPYRTKNNFKFIEKEKEINANLTLNNNSNISVLSVTTLKPKEAVLRGIRKRSLSVCIDGNEINRQTFLAHALHKTKQNRMVSFCSPANQTTIIDDIDNLIAKSIKKQKLKQTKEPLDKCKYSYLKI